MHIEQFGSLEGVARVKGELLVHLGDGAAAIVPDDEARLRPYLRDALALTTFGDKGDVRVEKADRSSGFMSADSPSESESSVTSSCSASVSTSSGSDGGSTKIIAHGIEIELELPFSQPYQVRNTLAAVAAVLAVGVRPSGKVDVAVSALRGEEIKLPDGTTVINDCYNASPLAMKAVLGDLAGREPSGQRIAVLGDMLELGPDERSYHLDVGRSANDAGVEVLVTVGKRAAAMLETYQGEGYAAADADEAAELMVDLVKADDLVLIKGSRGMGLEAVATTLSKRGQVLKCNTTIRCGISRPDPIVGDPVVAVDNAQVGNDRSA